MQKRNNGNGNSGTSLHYDGPSSSAFGAFRAPARTQVGLATRFYGKFWFVEEHGVSDASTPRFGCHPCGIVESRSRIKMDSRSTARRWWLDGGTFDRWTRSDCWNRAYSKYHFSFGTKRTGRRSAAAMQSRIK